MVLALLPLRFIFAILLVFVCAYAQGAALAQTRGQIPLPLRPSRQAAVPRQTAAPVPGGIHASAPERVAAPAQSPSVHNANFFDLWRRPLALIPHVEMRSISLAPPRLVPA